MLKAGCSHPAILRFGMKILNEEVPRIYCKECGCELYLIDEVLEWKGKRVCRLCLKRLRKEEKEHGKI